jgi:transposase InsO family protein
MKPHCGSSRAAALKWLIDEVRNSIASELAEYIEAQIEAFVEDYNHRRYHESLDNVIPADAYYGRAAAIIKQRERIKRRTGDKRPPTLPWGRCSV